VLSFDRLSFRSAGLQKLSSPGWAAFVMPPNFSDAVRSAGWRTLTGLWLQKPVSVVRPDSVLNHKLPPPGGICNAAQNPGLTGRNFKYKLA